MARSAKSVARKKGGRASELNGIVYPVNDRDKAFCARWLEHHDHNLAYEEAGFKPDPRHVKQKQKLKRFASYLAKMSEVKAEAVGQQLALEQNDILQEMFGIGFCNPQDYYNVVEEQREGKTVKVRRLKPIEELTRQQAAAITDVKFLADGSIAYRLPTTSERHPYLKDLGQHLGLFHPKLIQEHRHAHMHAHFAMRDADDKKLEEAEAMFLKALGPTARQMLGMQPETTSEEDG